MSLTKLSLLAASPLDIFELRPFSICASLPALTNLTVFFMAGLAIFSFFLIIMKSFSNYLKQPKGVVLIKLFLTFIKNTLRDIVGAEQHIHYILLVSLGFILIGFNLLGLLPYSLSVTSHFTVTFTLSFIFFIAFNIVGVVVNKQKLVLLWLPHGTPYGVTPFIVLIELVSYATRVFSLAIRLFANIMSGHTLLKILGGFAWGLLLSGGIFTYFAVFPFFIIFLISGLEFAIALLQAYVFLVLLTIYLNDVINLH
jgi:F-type H+-transporting ATPase subunit a